MSVQRQLDSALDAIRTRHPELDLRCEMFLAVPGQVTDPENWIVRWCIRGWEAVEGRPHQSRSGLSYAPDSNVLRQWGIPTARWGWIARRSRPVPRPWLDDRGGEHRGPVTPDPLLRLRDRRHLHARSRGHGDPTGRTDPGRW